MGGGGEAAVTGCANAGPAAKMPAAKIIVPGIVADRSRISPSLLAAPALSARMETV